MSAPAISYIVSVFDDYKRLPCMLASLAVQSHQDFEVIVVDNTVDATTAQNIRVRTYTSDVKNISYVNTKAISCYHSADMGVEMAQGEFVCFPSDDGYYMPMFGALMLEAAQGYPADLVLCEMIYDTRRHGCYAVMDTKAEFGHVDKTGFLLRKSKFPGFPGKPHVDVPAGCDGLLIDALVKSGVSHVKIPDILVVHN